MTTRTKSILIYIAGIITGVILTFAFFFVAASDSEQIDNIIMFDEPQQEINVKSFKVIQVLSDGNALATATEYPNYGMIVMFLAEEGDSYYDDQRINVPSDKRLMQIGTFKYFSRNEMEKTVPIVKILSK